MYMQLLYIIRAKYNKSDFDDVGVRPEFGLELDLGQGSGHDGLEVLDAVYDQHHWLASLHHVGEGGLLDSVQHSYQLLLFVSLMGVKAEPRSHK